MRMFARRRPSHGAAFNHVSHRALDDCRHDLPPPERWRARTRASSGAVELERAVFLLTHCRACRSERRYRKTLPPADDRGNEVHEDGSHSGDDLEAAELRVLEERLQFLARPSAMEWMRIRSSDRGTACPGRGRLSSRRSVLLDSVRLLPRLRCARSVSRRHACSNDRAAGDLVHDDPGGTERGSRRVGQARHRRTMTPGSRARAAMATRGAVRHRRRRRARSHTGRQPRESETRRWRPPLALARRRIRGGASSGESRAAGRCRCR